MGEFCKRLFASDLMPHGVCWAWEPWVVWSNVIPDAVIALSYFILSLTLLHLIRRRRELAFSWMVLLFGAFIFACGLTHALDVYNTWHGAFRLAGAVKALTAAASLGTALLLLRLTPKILLAPGLDQSLELARSLSAERIERSAAERRLQESRERLESEEADRALLQSQKLESMGLLAGGIAHDFNNLLGAILGNLGLAQMEINPMAPARQRLETIETLVVRASDLARQMLAYSGRGKFQLKTLNLNDLVREMTHLLGISISKKAVIRCGLDLALPAIEADPSQLQQVVMNLVINASEAIGERSGVITLGTHSAHLDAQDLARDYAGQKLVPGAFVCLEVADNGCGMAPEVMGRIFDPFFTTKFTGRGLGLAAIQGIVRGHGGGIRVQSEPGRGTTFRIIFPATSLAAEAGAPAQALAGYRGSGTVLVVDDEASIRAMAAGILGHIGFQALQAGDGLQALEQLRRHGPEICLVLMDLTMPNLDGEETYRAMRAEGFATPVILSSGFNEVEAVDRFIGQGLAGFLQKPYRAGDMLKLIRDVLA